MFLFCLNLKIGSVFAKVICLLAPASLGVYLIHVHPLVFGSIVKDAFVLFAYESPAVMALCVVAASVAILVGCTVIELLRIQLFKLAKVNQLCEYAGNRVNTLYLKIFRD